MGVGVTDRQDASSPSAASDALLQRLLEDDESLLASRDPKVDALLIERLYHNSLATRYVPIPMLFGAFFIYQQQLTWWQCLGLTALYLSATIYLDRLREAFSRSEGLRDPKIDWGLRFALGCGCTGLTWGLLGWLAYPPGDFALQAVLCVAWAGLALSTLNTRAVHLPSFYAFMIAMSVPFFARGFLFGEPSTVAMAFFGSILFAALCFCAQINNRRERSGAALRLRNAELLGEMDRARQVAESNHAQLQQAYRAMIADLAVTQRLAQTGSWRWQGDDKPVVWSDEFYRLLGLLPQSCPAALAAWLDRVHPDDRDSVRGHYQRLRQGAAQDAVHFRLADENIRHRLHSLAESTRGEDGSVISIRGLLRPATE